MKTVSKVALVSVLSALAVALAPAARASLTVTPGLTVANRCGGGVIVTVRYKSSSGAWVNNPPVGINGHDTRERLVSTSNSIIYYYAESMSETRKTRWQGDHSVTIGGKVYAMRQKQLKYDADKNRYVLSLSCN